MHLSSTLSVAFAADAGIASAVALVARLLKEDAANRVLVFCGAQDEEHAQPLEDLLALKDQYLDRLSLSFVMNREPDESELLSGALDAAKVAALASKLFDAHSVSRFYVYGPKQLADDVGAVLGKVGVEPTRVHKDAESASTNTTSSTAPLAANETRVEFVMDGRRRSFSMHTRTESILDAAARAGVELPFSCKAGVCSTCRTKLVKGNVELTENYALEDWELEQGFILACQAHATTSEIELTYDEK